MSDLDILSLKIHIQVYPTGGWIQFLTGRAWRVAVLESPSNCTFFGLREGIVHVL